MRAQVYDSMRAQVYDSMRAQVYITSIYYKYILHYITCT